MAASPTFGRVQEYEPENELFSAYLERVQLFFLANGVEDDKKVPIFLSVVGSKTLTYSLLRNLVAPALPQDKTLVQLVAILKSHFEPKPVIIAERFHFHRRSQTVGESLNSRVFGGTTPAFDTSVALLEITSRRHSMTASYAESTVRVFKRDC